MGRRNRRWAAAAWLLAAAAGCGSPPPPQVDPAPAPAPPTRKEDALVGDLAPGGQRIVVLLDDSGSMLANDPDGMAFGATELLVALSRPEDAVGVVRYSDAAEVAMPLASVGDAVQRKRYAKIRAGNRQGETNYVAPLELAEQMLTAADAPPGSVVVFVSDGFANIGGGPYEVVSRAERLAKRGWRVPTVALGRLVDRAVLAEVAATTGAGHYRARTPTELFDVFSTIAAEHLGYVKVPGPFEPLSLPETTQRLAYVAALGGSVGAVSCGSEPLSGLRYEHPLFGAQLHLAPTAGVYSATVTEAPKYTTTLVDTGFRAAFADERPPAEVSERRFPVQIDVVADDGGPIPDAMLDALVARVSVERAADGQVLLSGRLKRRKDAPAFGALIPLPKGFQPVDGEAINVLGSVTFEAGETALTLACRVSCVVRTPPPAAAAPPPKPTPAQQRDALLAALSRSAGPVELTGAYGWVEAAVPLDNSSGALPATVAVTPQVLQGPDGEVALAPRVDIEVVDGGWDGALAKGGTQTLTYRVFLASDLPPGQYEGSLGLTVSVAGADPAEGRVPVRLEVQR